MFSLITGKGLKAARQSIRQSTIALVQDLVFFARVYFALFILGESAVDRESPFECVYLSIIFFLVLIFYASIAEFNVNIFVKIFID